MTVRILHGDALEQLRTLPAGFDAILIEREAEYVEIARRRIAGDCPLFADLTLGLPLEIAA